MSILSHVAGRFDQDGYGYLPGASPRMWSLFREFLRRYRDLQRAQRRETFWLLVVIGLGMLVVFLPVPGHHNGVVLSLVCVVLLLLAARRYQAASRMVRHLGVNVHILYHHLLGKLEVGFCDHQVPCHCAEEFRRYVWKTYHISLYGTVLSGESSLKER